MSLPQSTLGGNRFRPAWFRAISLSVLYLLRGNPDDPAAEHWGGSFAKTGHGPNYWHDNPDPALRDHGKNGAGTVNRWREAYLRNRQERMQWARGKR